MKNFLRLCVVAAVVAVLLLCYQRAGWSRMETACSADRSSDPTWDSVEFGWSWSPPGFQCTYDSGRQRTSLWF